VATLSFVEILGEEGEVGIGQYDHFVMVLFAHVRIRQNDYFLVLLAVGRSEAKLGEARRRVHSGCGSRCQYATSQGLAALASLSLPLFTEVRGI
jgi:hypothetical protein